MKWFTIFRREDAVIFILAVLGCGMYAAWYGSLFPESAFKNGLSKAQIENRSADILNIPELYRSPDQALLDHDISITLDKERLHRAHEYYGLKTGNRMISDSIPVYRWEMAWNYRDSGDFQIAMGGKKRINESNQQKTPRDPMRMELDIHGRLMNYFARPVDGESWFVDTVIGGRDVELPLLKSQTLSVDSARAIVESFLKKTEWYDFASAIKPVIKFSMNKNIPVYEFMYTGRRSAYPETQSLRVVLRQYKINLFEATYAAADAEKKESAVNKIKSIMELVLFIFFIVITLIYFFIKLKKGAFDVKLSLFYGGIMMAAFCGFFYAMTPGEAWYVYLLIFIFGGLVWLIVGGIAVAVSSALCYEIWPDKYQTFESIRMGKMFNQRFGLSLFRGISWGVLAAGSLIITFYSLPNISVSLKELKMEIVLGSYGAMYLICLTVYGSLITTHTQFLLTLAFIQKKLRKAWIVASVGILISVLMPLVSLDFSPVWLYLITGLIIGGISVYVLLRYDFLSFFAMAVSLNLLISGGIFFVLGDTVQIVILSLFLGGVALLAIAGLLSRETGEDILDYVPQYVREMEDRRRMEQEFEIARKIQTTMLCCRIPESPFLEIASLCEPAYEVGGDYYDFIRFPDHTQNRIGVVIGDVSGKGVSAAFYMTLIKGILQTQAQITPESTRTTLIRANDIFYDQVERNKFISMIYAIFDFGKGSVQLSRAGHNPLVIKKSEAADPETLTPKGMALGLAKGKAFSDFIEETEIRFKGGDVFVFYTDGLSEAMNKYNEEYGEERLYETIQKHTQESAPVILQKIYDSVTAFAGKTPQHDDMTMIVVKIK